MRVGRPPCGFCSIEKEMAKIVVFCTLGNAICFASSQIGKRHFQIHYYLGGAIEQVPYDVPPNNIIPRADFCRLTDTSVPSSNTTLHFNRFRPSTSSCLRPPAHRNEFRNVRLKASNMARLVYPPTIPQDRMCICPRSKY